MDDAVFSNDILLLLLLVILIGVIVILYLDALDDLRKLDPLRRSMLLFLGFILLSGSITALIINYWPVSQGLVSGQDRVLVFWLLALPIQYAIFTVRGLVTGEELKVGKHTFSHSRYARLVILCLLFAFLGFLVGGKYGVIVGVLVATGIAITIQHSIDCWPTDNGFGPLDRVLVKLRVSGKRSGIVFIYP